MKVAAYQSTIAYRTPEAMLPVLREQVERCEDLGVELLCCAEGVLGGLADYVEEPATIAIRVADGQLAALLAPLASARVTTILGFTEQGDNGRLYNTAAVWSGGAVLGVYRKRHPAIRRSVYDAGHACPVFTIGALTFGVMICRDSLFPTVAHTLVARGAQALLVPTNNGMPVSKGDTSLVTDARRIDTECALAHDVPVIRADVVGRCGTLVSDGATGIVNRSGHVVGAPVPGQDALVVAAVDLPPRGR